MTTNFNVLLQAIKSNNILAVQRILDKSPEEVNTVGMNGVTPLMTSVISGNRHITKLLLKKGANVNKRDGDGRTALIISGLYGKIEDASLLLRYGADVDEKDED